MQLWLLAAINRTVGALPRLHPWRLGDDKGVGRVLQWTAQATTDFARPVYASVAMTQRDPNLPTGDEPPFAGDGPFEDWGLGPVAVNLGSAVRGLADATCSTAGGALRDGLVGAWPRRESTPPRWVGLLTRFEGSWLPPLAVLPSERSGIDDPATGWVTESVDFDAAHRVHADDARYAAAVLAPHVMALVMDQIPDGSAVTIAGDAMHVWWPYESPYDAEPGRVTRGAAAAAELADAIPRFVLASYPDRSGEVEAQLADRAAAADRYRGQRQPGRSTDPVLQRIYSAARREAGLGD